MVLLGGKGSCGACRANLGAYGKDRLSDTSIDIFQRTFPVADKVGEQHIVSAVGAILAVTIRHNNAIPPCRHRVEELLHILKKGIGALGSHVRVVGQCTAIHHFTLFHGSILFAVRSVQFGGLDAVVVGTFAKSGTLSAGIHDAQCIVDVYPRARERGEGDSVKILLSKALAVVVG